MTDRPLEPVPTHIVVTDIRLDFRSVLALAWRFFLAWLLIGLVAWAVYYFVYAALYL